MTTAAIYTRISKDVRDGEGVARQEELCRERVAREGWTLAGVFTDNDISASARSRKVRPEYDRLLTEARAGRIDVIVAYSNSRLTRRMRELEDLVDLHDAHGVRISTVVSGDDDLSTADGRMVARIKASVDSAEAERTSERVLAQQRARRASGIQRTRSSFGWSGDELVPEQAEPLKVALADVLKGVSTSEVARRWNRDGVPSVTGVAWKQARVKELLIRWRNAGVVVHKGEPLEGVTGTWETVCDRETLGRVRAELLDPARRTMTPGRPPSALLSTVAHCGKCGRKLVASKITQKAKSYTRKDGRKDTRKAVERLMYRCSGALTTTGDKCFLGIERKILDKAVLDELRLVIAQLDGAEGVTPGAEEKARMAALREERVGIEGRERETALMMAKGTLSVAALQEALEEMAARRTAIDAELSEIQGRYLLGALLSEVVAEGRSEVDEILGAAEVGTLSLDRVAEVGKRIEGLTLMQRRSLVKRFLSVTVMPGRGPERLEIRPAAALL